MSKSVHVNLESESTWNEFRAFVENKHGKLHTVMGIELDRAIRMYLDSQTAPIKLSGKKNLSKGKFDLVKEEFIRNTSEADEFQQGYAERLIKEKMGVYTPTSIQRYCNELSTLWLLR